ncbi:MAG TPA: hypothetical protein VFO93_16555 [Hymenobacter sp.]|uniref:hypothetical protein n=1 Tax=Hymenobacter sp. TaxID=1898978 RepID=UPI002D7F584E|nr:hypothetical protein [Hymenobacter sp.]HET9505156.1 hypothetical protein [Hymenobacter sp.]
MSDSLYPAKFGRRMRQWVGVALVLGSASASAQSVAGYQLAASAGTFTPITGGTAVPAIIFNNASSGSLPIGFSFPFAGATYTNFRVSSNGLLGFGSALSTVGEELSNTMTSPRLTGTSLPVLAPFWTDLAAFSGSGATAQYTTTGTAPSRVLTMQWLDFYDVNGEVPAYVSFQVKLYETSGRIEYVYRKGPPGEANDATIGMKGADGSFLSLTNSGSAPGVSATVSADRLGRPATGQVYAFLPAAAPLAATPGLAAAAVEVFPNPAQQCFTVRVPAVAGVPTVQADLLNSLGQVVRQQAVALPAAGAEFMVPTADLAAGLYSLRLVAGPAALTRRVVVH